MCFTSWYLLLLAVPEGGWVSCLASRTCRIVAGYEMCFTRWQWLSLTVPE